MRIYGIGLPRTATSSLSSALRDLGFPGKHKCILHDKHYSDDMTGHSSMVYNGFYKNYKTLIDSNSKFILTIRDSSEWEDSIKKFETSPKDMPDIAEYEKEVINFFKRNKISDNLLVLNIFESTNAVEILCDFLGVKKDNYMFPHIKQ